MEGLASQVCDIRKLSPGRPRRVGVVGRLLVAYVIQTNQRAYLAVQAAAQEASQ